MSSIKQFVIFLLFIIPCGVGAQQINTLYFLENTPIRNYLNPAFIPVTQTYVSLPIIGYSEFNIGNNSLTISDLVYKKNNQTITFLNPTGNIDKFYSKLNPTTVFRTDLQTTIVGFGFKHKDVAWNFAINAKFNAMIGIPKDFFKISLYGTPNIDKNSYSLTTLQSDVCAYTEFALGYSKKLKNDKWTVGARLKFLMGAANLSISNSKIGIEADMNKWNLNGNGALNISSPIKIAPSANLKSYSITTPTTLADWFKPSGYGAGVDIGVVYKFNERLHFSAALSDLGFIRWSKNVQNLNYSTNYTFDGVAHITPSMNAASITDMYTRLTTGNALVDSLSNAFLTSSTISNTMNSFTTGTTAKLNMGAEYYLWSNYVTLGLLSRTFFFKKTVTEEITTSVNIRPVEWFNSSLTYSLLNGAFSTFGAGIGLRTGPIHWFIAADYIPLIKTTVLLSDINANYPSTSVTLPYKSKNYNLALGMTLVFGEKDKFENSALANHDKGLINSTSFKLIPTKKTKIRNSNSRGHMKPDKLKNNCHCDWKQ